MSGSMLFQTKNNRGKFALEEVRDRGRGDELHCSFIIQRDQVASLASLVSALSRVGRLDAPTFESIPLDLERYRSEGESHGRLEVLEQSGGRAESQVPSRRDGQEERLIRARDERTGEGRRTHFDSAATRTAALSSS